MGDQTRWWWPSGEDPYYWPPGVPKEEKIEHFVTIFRQVGYEVCASAAFVAGYEKVAIYQQRGVPTHAARQVHGGWWTSKLGEEVDIVHESLDALDGPIYGSATVFLQRSVKPLRQRS